MRKKNIILFGGSFDPVHRGHIEVAVFAAQYLHAQKCLFVPAKRSPLKINAPLASDEHRLEMIKLAIADNLKLDISDYEIKKLEPSYTIDTVNHFKNIFDEDTELCWLVGADCLKEFPYWHKIKNLIDICKICIMYRAGCEKPDISRYADILGEERILKLQHAIIPTPLVDISSTEIRKLLKEGQDANELLPRNVAQYIQKNQLYK